MSRVVDAWNKLPEEVVEADILAIPETHLDRGTNIQRVEKDGANTIG